VHGQERRRLIIAPTSTPWGSSCTKCCAASRPVVGQALASCFSSTITVAPKPLRSIRPDVPAQLEAVVLKALEKDYKDRIQTMEEFTASAGASPSGSTLMGEEQPMASPPGAWKFLAPLPAARSFPALRLGAHDAVVRRRSSSCRQPGCPGQAGRSTSRLGGRGALALCALAAGVAVKLWGRSAAPWPGWPAGREERPCGCPTIAPPIAPPPVPVRRQPSPEFPHSSPSLPSRSPIRRVAGRESSEPAAKNTPLSKRERAKKKSSGRSERHNPEPMDSYRPAPVAPVIAPRPVRLPVHAAPCSCCCPAGPKVIRREKF